MTDDALLEELRQRLASEDGSRVHRPATASAVARFESDVELVLPTFYKRLLTEVANGGFGPGFGIIGIPPDGYVDDDLGGNLLEAYLEGRKCEELPWRMPRGFLPLCNWGCGSFSLIDALSPDAAVVTEDVLEDRIEYTETAPALALWLERWLSGAKLEDEMYEITGHRRGINPFTRQPMDFPLRRRIGRKIDVGARR
jgi:hypothetical protein